MNINKTIIAGNLTRDPELKYIQAGSAVCSFSIANNRTWTNKQTGQKTEEVSFFNCTAFGRTGEVINEHMRKGSPILIEGRIQQDRWQDRDTGQNRDAVKIVVEQFHFVGSKSDTSSGQHQDTNSNTGPEQGSGVRDSNFENDDVPF